MKNEGEKDLVQELHELNQNLSQIVELIDFGTDVLEAFSKCISVYNTYEGEKYRFNISNHDGIYD